MAMAADMTCTIVTSKFGDRWVHLPASGRVFFNYIRDGEPTEWHETRVPWIAMQKHMFYAVSERKEQEIPKGIRQLLTKGDSQ